MGIFDRIDRIAEQLGDLIVPDDVRVHVELGAAYLDRGELDSAVGELRRAVELRPDHPRALYLLGVAYARRGDHEDAAKVLERAASQKRAGIERAGFPEAWLALAEVERRRGNDDAAAAAYHAALDGGAFDATMRAEIYRGLGVLYLRQRRYDKAVRELRKAVAAVPDDPPTQGLLGRALYLRGDYDTARVCLERAAQAARPDPLGLSALGDLYERWGRADDAKEAYTRALASAEPDVEVSARLGLARLHLTAGANSDARAEALRALQLAPLRPDVLLLLGRVDAAAQQYADALAAYDRALEMSAGVPSREGPLLLFDRRGLLEEALATALLAGATTRADAYAAQLLLVAPDHVDALAAQARAAAAEGELERAGALVERALAHGDTVEARLAAADVAMRRERTHEAASALVRAAELAPADPRPRARLAEVYRHGRARPAQDLYALLTEAHRLFSQRRALAELAPEAGRLVEMLNRPLLVTVMGEFNAGKSTFVNALIGEEVVPMGITPTTATINVLKYGAERKGRVVYLDDETREVSWAEVPKLLRGLSTAEARRIRMVEVLYPLETLERVNVVDTPGLNSIHPEHEETARRFIAEADAVVWLFSADQAAKATEGEALARIRTAGKKILGVLNKVDRLDGDAGEGLVEHVKKTLGEHLLDVVPSSAKAALAAREGLSGKVGAALEQHFFSRARKLKREAAATRLSQLLAQGRALGEKERARHPLAPLAEAEARVRAEKLSFERDFIVAERRRLNQAADAVYAACAREVLDFVRPRRWPFGSNEAAPADRDFLIQLLDERLGALLEAARARVAAEAERAIDIVRAVDQFGQFARHGRAADDSRGSARLADQDAHSARRDDAADDSRGSARLADQHAHPARRDGAADDWRGSARLADQDAHPARRAADDSHDSARLADDSDARYDAELSLLGEQVFGRFAAFARGYLRGGRVDDFFTRRLPKLALDEAAIQRALERDAPWNDDIAEAELRTPLRLWGERFYGGLLSRLGKLRTTRELALIAIEERLIAPVEELALALDTAS